MIRRLLVCFVFLLTTVAAQEIPPGTVLPVMLGSTLDARRAKPGQTIKARLMQNVRLPSGSDIPAGATVTGRVLEVAASGKTQNSRIALAFDRIAFRGNVYRLSTNLRAIASIMAVFDAQLPTSNFDDYGTSTSDWTTIQVGGDAVYRGDGTVVSPYSEIVGKSSDYGAVTAKLKAMPEAACRGEVEGNEHAQALWVFSTSACGVYGFRDLRITHAGRTNPLGQVILESDGNLHVTNGSGFLLRVDTAAPAVPTQ